VVVHLVLALEEDVGSIGTTSVLTFLRDGPSHLGAIMDAAVVSRYSLQLDLDVSLH